MDLAQTLIFTMKLPSGTALPKPHEALRETMTRFKHLKSEAVSVGPLLAVSSSTSLQACVRVPFAVVLWPGIKFRHMECQDTHASHGTAYTTVV